MERGITAPVLIHPEWAAPANVCAAMSTRAGGVSQGRWASLNLGAAVGDDAAAVRANRQRFAAALGAQPVWLEQVHGVRVVRVGLADLNSMPMQADAAWSTEPGLACAVQVADCLPVLLAVRDGAAVAAAHAGWRGLAGGVLEATLLALQHGVGADPGDVVAWLGPCIGPRRFEVGEDVLRAFSTAPGDAASARFVSRPRPDGAPRWLADLAGLARQRLERAGVRDIADARACTVEEPASFFSFRRDGVTGRLGAAVWRRA